MVERLKRTLDLSILMVIMVAFFELVPYILINFPAFFTSGKFIPFAMFLAITQLGMTIPEVLGIAVGFAVFGGIIGFIMPPSYFDKEFVICQWWS